ncbi:MAG TPA: DUF1254 domain-containing protein [Verrucomicrobiae bacterium]|nr:DUF1254 domain-containing protein [Verrucomicrobiae bacterium]
MVPARKARFSVANLDAAAVEAYLFGFPLLVMSAAARHATNAVGFNRFLHRFDLAETWLRGIVLPNRDLVFSIAWLDLRLGPVVFTSLQTENYYVTSLIDAWTNVFATLGTRATGNTEHQYVISGPRWTGVLPAHCTHIVSPTNLACIVAQTSLDDVSQTHALATLHDHYRLDPMGEETLHLDPASVLRDVDRLGAEDAFARIRELMVDNPPSRADSGAVEALAALAGHESDSAIATAVTNARATIDDTRDADESNGWTVNADAGDYGTDYVHRARAARYDLLSNTVADTLCAQARVDAEHAPLRGGKSYVLHFDPWDEPPARAFWSLCAFDEERRFATGGYGPRVLESRQPLMRRANRSLDLYVAHDEPHDGTRNWLQCPAADFTLALRLYWPSPAALSGVWTPPAILSASGTS